MKTITMKFGGTSVGSVESIRNVIYITNRELERGNRVILTVSAMAGVTDILLSSIQLALDGDRWGYLSIAEKLRDKHQEAINSLVSAGVNRDRITRNIGKLIDEFIELCQAINVLGEVTPRIRDAVTAFGEKMSARLVAMALLDQGVDARPVDASEVVVTDENHQNAAPIWELTEPNIRNTIFPLIESGVVPVVTGFIGATKAGVITTLGRGGGDFSGAIFAAYTDSDELIIWTDVNGVMTTDPRVDKRARVLPYVSFQEVGELAYYGAKVLHPKTVQPLLNRGIPLYVRNTFNPDHPGTLIGPTPQPSSTVVKAVTSVKNVSMITIAGRGMIGVPGIAGRAGLATAKAGANILMISQSSSEQSMCFVVTDERALNARDLILQEFDTEIANQNIETIEVSDRVVIVTVVGSGMRGTPGVAGRVFTALGNEMINVLAIAQGSSECSISFVIDQDELQRAVIVLHDLALEAVPEV